MKFFYVIKGLLSALLLVITTGANAVIIEGSFIGTVRSFENGAPDVNFDPVWDSVAIGSEVSGSFWYDTDKAPGNSSEFLTSAMFLSYTDEWIKSSFTIDGKTYDISDSPLMDRYSHIGENVWQFDFDPVIDNATTERFRVQDYRSSRSYAGEFSSRSLTVDVYSEVKPLLNGLGLIQEFDWYDLGDLTSYAEALVSVDFTTDQNPKYGLAWVDVSEFHVHIKKPTNVPEPFTFILLCSGFLILITRRFFCQNLFKFTCIFR